MLEASTDRNPHVAEPRVLLAQYHFRAGRYGEALAAAGGALERFYAFGGTWDKRLSYEAWVNFARLLAARAERCYHQHDCARAHALAARVRDRAGRERCTASISPRDRSLLGSFSDRRDARVGLSSTAPDRRDRIPRS